MGSRQPYRSAMEALIVQQVLLQNCFLAGQLLLGHLLQQEEHASIPCVWLVAKMLKVSLPTLMSSGQPSSCLFPLTLRWIRSRVSSRVGRGPFISTAVSWTLCSSVEPKLLGRVLLRGRVWGPSSVSARCLASVGVDTVRRGDTDA